MRLFIFLAFLCLAGTGYAQTDVKFQVDTLITFHPETMEEVIELVVVEVSAENTEEANQDASRFEFVKDEAGNIMMDTLITFHPDTYEEEIRIVKRMRAIKPE